MKISIEIFFHLRFTMNFSFPAFAAAILCNRTYVTGRKFFKTTLFVEQRRKVTATRIDTEETERKGSNEE